MRSFFAQLLDLIYKKRCYFCKSSKDNAVMCGKCYDEIEHIPYKAILSLQDTPVYSAALYTKTVQKLIRGVKYHNQKELAFFQAKLMFDYWTNITEKKESYIIVPVPLYKKREKKRKYNHMLLVAKELSKLTGYKINNDLLVRIKDTKPQYRLSQKEREANLKNAFKAEKDKYNGENILIIDDILTTGSTLKEMIKELEKTGITDITAFTTSCTPSHM